MADRVWVAVHREVYECLLATDARESLGLPGAAEDTLVRLLAGRLLALDGVAWSGPSSDPHRDLVQRLVSGLRDVVVADERPLGDTELDESATTIADHVVGIASSDPSPPAPANQPAAGSESAD